MLSLFTDINRDSNIYEVLEFYYNYLYSTNFDIIEDTLNEFKNKKGDLNGTSNKNPLLLAISRDDVSLVKLLLSLGARYDAIKPELPYIARAIYKNAFNCLEFLLQDSNINFSKHYQNNRGIEITNVSYAMINGLSEDFVLKILDRYIKDGGDLAFVSDSNNMLHTALYYDYINVANKLNELNSSLKTHKNKIGKTPGDYCIYDTNFCKGLPKTIAKKDGFYLRNIEDIIDEKFPDLDPEKFRAKIENLNFNVEETLGKGGFGSTQKVKIGASIFALKKQQPCTALNHSAFRKICIAIKDSLLTGTMYYQLIENDVYSYVSYPNVISEAIISTFLNKLIDSNVCHNFVKTKSFIQQKDKFYTVMELLDGTIVDLYQKIQLTEEHYINFLTQTIYTFYVLQENKISHGDIHPGNIMYRKIRSPFTKSENSAIPDYTINGVSTENIEYFEYCIDGINIQIKNLGYLIKIIDFGLALMDTKINNKNFWIRPMHILNIEGSIFKEYNRNLDLGQLMLTFMSNPEVEKEQYNNFFLFKKVNITDEVLSNANNLKTIILNGNRFNYTSQYRPYRTSKALMYKKLSPYSSIAMYLHEVGKKYAINTMSPNIVFNIFSVYYPIDMSTYIPIPTFNDSLNLNNLYKISNNISIGNYVCNNIQLSNGHKIPNRQYMSIVKIDINSNTIKLDSKCCNISGPKLLSTLDTDHTYVSINGTFFNIKGDLTPIGFYQDNKIVHTEIIKYLQKMFIVPPVYEDMYYVIMCDTKNKITLVPYKSFITNITSYDLTNYNYVITGGPLLYNKDTNIGVTNLMKSKNTGKSIDLFDCDPKSKFNTKITNANKYNCGTILPGEFTHGKQPNPRSMLIITNDNNIILVSIEGRGQRGFGMTFEDMEKLSIELGARYAINLDGGRSSHITVKPKGYNGAYVMNPMYKTFTGDLYPVQQYYPVGNILTFME